ncbi:MAG: phospholipid carrier-dependent glycosyltransferase [Calditrichaeota bacterium]|nr:MAG: phospholipid carrier-dependent glycosyltransferase [Calditrichota bacterium]
MESRAGLINIFAVFFSLLAYDLFLRSRAPFPRKPRWLYLAGAGAASGAAAAVKWIGAASLGVILLTYAWSWLRRRRGNGRHLPLPDGFPRRIGRIHPALVLTCCVVLPAAVYAATFIPHLRQNHDYSFVELHKQMFGYHAHLQEGHHYASRWWSWPLALRPVSYYWQVDEAEQQVSTILNLGNPILWWLSIPAVLVGVWFAVKKKSFPAQFCVLAFALHYLPFAFIGRATFSYHYMGALPFVFMLQGFILEKLWRAGGWRRELAFFTLLAAFFSAVYFYPVWTALPIPLGAFYQRMWLVSWI